MWGIYFSIFGSCEALIHQKTHMWLSNKLLVSFDHIIMVYILL